MNKGKKQLGKGKGSNSTNNKLSEDMVTYLLFRIAKSKMHSNSTTSKTQVSLIASN